MTDFSYQLFCSRNFPPLTETLKMVAAAGYRQVEGFGSLYASPALVSELKANLADAGLKMPSGHFMLDQLENDPDTVLDIARSFSMSAVVCPYLFPDQRPSDAKSWVDFGKRLQKAGKPYVDAGLDFGWHNHDFEFVPLADGSIPQERIFEGGPDLKWEADLAWVVKGGADPLVWMEKLAAHLIAIHVKDIAPAGQNLDEDGWADVGHGTLDWPKLMAGARRYGAKLFVIEHDNPKDHKRFATRSIAAARNF